ncbi:MAG TPA: hypothetical protein VIL69_02325 [Roseomonas sp.]|jgi:hypothetical protein
MAVPVLTTASTVQCPHGGRATLTTANALAMDNGAPLLLLTDTHVIAGCPFQIPIGTGTKPQPCVILRWTSGAVFTRVNGVPVLLQTSTGLCFSVEQIPQGPPLVVQASPAVKGI